MSTLKKKGKKDRGTPPASSSSDGGAAAQISPQHEIPIKENPVDVKRETPPMTCEDVADQLASISLNKDNKEEKINELFLLHGVSNKTADSMADKDVTIENLKKEKKESASLEQFQLYLRQTFGNDDNDNCDDDDKTKGVSRLKTNEMPMGVSVLLAKDILEDGRLTPKKKVEQVKKQVDDAFTCMENMQKRKIAGREREKKKKKKEQEKKKAEQEKKKVEQEKKKAENRDQIKGKKEE